MRKHVGLKTKALSFLRETGGNVAMMIGFAAIPMMMGIGAAVDYARLSSYATQLKAAADSAALAGAAETIDPTVPLTPTLSAHRRAVAINAFNANLRSTAEFSNVEVTVGDLPNGIRVTAAATIGNVFGQIVGSPVTALGAVAEAGLATNSNFEVAFVLDNTGSMAASNKLTTLKSAMNKFLGKLQAASTSAGNVRVSIVPFANMVRVDASHAGRPWLRQSAADLAAWGGCIGDRAPPFESNGAAPDLSAPASLYEGVDGAYAVFPLPPFLSLLPPFSSPNPGAACSQSKIMPLTDDFGAMYNSVAGMNAVGTTNLTIGLAWGLNALSPGEPFGGANGFGGSHRKLLVLVTDGLNTQSRWTGDAATMNAATRAMCDTIKAKGVTIYTVGVMNEDAALLTYCASTPSKHYYAPTADKVPDIFNMLAGDLTTVRLTK